MRYLLIFFLTLVFSLTPPSKTFAGDDCIIANFDSHITLLNDGGLDINETLLVDCGDLPDKHGIFRILPTKANSPARSTPIRLLSITDADGQEHRYETIKDRVNHTLTWKIGDPDKTIQGLQTYRIHYLVEHAVTSADANRDQLYWNLNGNFWQLDTEKFKATIDLPVALSESNTIIELTSGSQGSNDNSLSHFHWSSNNQITVEATEALLPYQGITLLSSFPAGMVKAYQPTYWERYGQQLQWLWLLLPLSIGLVCFRLWRRYGDDPNLRKPIIAYYEPPLKLRPLELGLLETYGNMKNQFLTATIIDLAVRGYLTLKEVPKKWLLGKNDWQIIKIKEDVGLEIFEKTLLKALFSDGEETALSKQVNHFYTNIEDIRRDAYDLLVERGVLEQRGIDKQLLFGVMALLTTLTMIYITVNFGLSFIFLGSILISIVTIIIFAILIPRRTFKGAQAYHELEGFKLYMKTAEQYRAQFYEKEGIFEQLLPYAIAFGLTKEWIKATKKIMGGDFVSHYPVWYVGTSGQAFAADSFSENLNSLSHSIGASLTSSPSSSGGGSSGSGGGGGGGGSW